MTPEELNKQLDKAPKSARAVCKVLAALGFPDVELWKDSQTKHYVWGDMGGSITGSFISQTIMWHDLRLSEVTYRWLLRDFLTKALESDLIMTFEEEKWKARLEILKLISAAQNGGAS